MPLSGIMGTKLTNSYESPSKCAKKVKLFYMVKYLLMWIPLVIEVLVPVLRKNCKSLERMRKLSHSKIQNQLILK